MKLTGNLAYWLGTLSVSFTTFYSYRLVFLTFLNDNRSLKQHVIHAHEANPIMAIPLMILAFGSLFIGYLTKDMIIGLGSSFWGQSLFILSENVTFLEAEYLPYHIKMIPFLFSHLGIFFAYHTTFFIGAKTHSDFGVNRRLSSPRTTSQEDIWQLSFQKNLMFYRFTTSMPILIKFYTFFNQKWHFDDLYNRFLVQKVIDFGYHISFRLFDAGWIAYLGPYGLSSSIQYGSRKFSQLQTGFVYHYAFIILVAITLFIIFLFSWDLIPFLSSSENALYFVFFITFFCWNHSFEPKKKKKRS